MYGIERERDYSAKEAAEWLNLKHLEVIRRIRRGDIKAHKVGWVWVVKGRDIADAMKSDWFKRRTIKN